MSQTEIPTVTYWIRRPERRTENEELSRSLPVDEIQFLVDPLLRQSLERQNNQNQTGSKKYTMPVVYEDGTFSHAFTVRREPIEL